MKKLLIVSLFLLTMIGLMAQVPHSVVFDLQTEAGGYHPDNTVSFRAKEFHPTMADEQWNMFFPTNPLKEIYWHWNSPEENILGFTSNQITITDEFTPGRMLIQAQGMNNFGMCNLYVWFKDADGNEAGPFTVVKSATSETQYPDVVAWGGPAAPTTPGWATLLGPVDAEATSAPLDVILNWEASAVEPIATGFDFYFNGTFVEEVTMTTDYLGSELALAYATDYTWGVRPYVEDGIAKGMKGSRNKVYAGTVEEMPVWSFRTMDEPAPLNPDAWATIGTPGLDAMDVAIDAQLTWTYEGTVVPTGYMLEWNGGEAMDLGNVMTYNPMGEDDLAYGTNYTWSVIPYVDDSIAKRGMKATRAILEPINGEKPVWSFTTIEFYSETETVGGVVIDIHGPYGFVPNTPVELEDPDLVPLVHPLPLNAGAFLLGFTFDQGIGSYTFQFDTGFPGLGVVYINGVVYYSGALGVVTVTIDFLGGKEPVEVVVTEETLPVELSSFTAVAHAGEYVTLNWVTESESNLVGYNVYRAETQSFEQAMRINPTTVTPNNSTQTSTYTYTDNEVETATYYYWLEVSELSNENTFHGPIVVRVEDDAVVPGITETTFRNFGPSPFTSSTSTSLRVKEGETASVTIYNLLGQVVNRESFNAGEHNYTFNGRDLNNKTVANGIYFVRMTSPTESKSFKIVKIK